MKFKNIIILITFIFFAGCEQLTTNKSSKLDLKPEKKYKNIGFSLIYNDNLKIKNLDSRSLQIFHKNLKRKSFVKITNPLNDKSLIAEVKSNKIKFSNFYNSIISNRIAETLEQNPELYDEFMKILNKKGNDQENFIKAYELFANYKDNLENVKNIKTNTLIITGSDDPGSTPDMSKNLNKDIQNSTYIEIKNGKHLCTIEYADEVNNAIMKHINNV